MLSSNQLSQLNQLKEDIRAKRDLACGVVRATSGRYGFINLDDGREVYLSPEQMERVLPGDKVEVEVIQNDRDQSEATLQKLISSSTKFLCGQYRVRGKGHFIAAEDNQLNRWIFIPPKGRGKAQDGDYITAKLTQHPYKDGRAQAIITKNIGNGNTDHIERLYSVAKFQLHDHFNKDTFDEAEALFNQENLSNNHLQDLRELRLITIDSAGTRDMDDALAITSKEDGWHLSVAIAGPGFEITNNSTIDKTARKRGQSVYFADKSIPMLPEKLATDRYSLQCDKERVALVFSCEISHKGECSNIKFTPAIVKSDAKLSYTQVAAILNDTPYNAPEHLSDASAFTEELQQLQACSKALYEYRETHFVVHEHKPDFSLILNEKGKLESIQKMERNCAHTIVEECMLLTNRCAGNFLAQHNTGIFIHHKGFRQERRDNIEALLSEKTGADIVNTAELQGYLKTIKTLQQNTDYQPLLAIQQRFLEPSVLNHQPSPHFGLGFEHYATITSPIRRYQDLYNQRAIYRILCGESSDTLQEKEIEQLQDSLNNGRHAVTYMNQKLICDYLQSKMGQTFTGTISLLTNQGVGVRLNDTGIEGFIPATKDDKISFNNQRMELTWNKRDIMLEQTVDVTLNSIDTSREKPVFSWTEDTIKVTS